MDTARAPVVAVRSAQRPGSETRPTEDRIFTTDNAVIVLDGASQPEATARNGGWLADRLGAELAAELHARPGDDLASVLERSIRVVADRHWLHSGQSPSTTVSIVRWHANTVEVLVLCDSLVIVADRNGQVHQVRDDRLASVAHAERPTGFAVDDPDRWQALVEAQRRMRNVDGGYWVAEATPEAARHAVRASWPINEVDTVLAMTDGVSIGVDRYGVPVDWPTAVAMATDDPARLVNAIHAAETADPHGHRWPRSKRHDDKALVVIRFNLGL